MNRRPSGLSVAQALIGFLQYKSAEGPGPPAECSSSLILREKARFMVPFLLFLLSLEKWISLRGNFPITAKPMST